MSEIDNEIAELEKKLAEKRAAKEAQDRKIVVNVTKLNVMSGRVTLLLSKPSFIFDDFIRLLYPYRPTVGEYIIEVKDLEKVIEWMKPYAEIEVLWEKKSKDVYEEWKNAPDIQVDIRKSWCIIKLGMKMRGSLYLNQELASFTQDVISKELRFAVAELHKFPTSVKKLYGDVTIVYSEVAQAELLKQLERRSVLAELANAMDTEWPNPFTQPGMDLKGHQRVAAKFCSYSDNRAIIAYDMGTGKSPTSVGIAEAHEEWERVVVICPASLKTNWKREIFKFTGKEAIIFQGVEPDELAIEYLVDKKSKYFIINYDIIGRKFGEVVKDGKVVEKGVQPWVELFNAVGIDLFIIDEAHYIKNLDSKRSQGVRNLKFSHVLPMSGTPIVNRPMEIWPLLNIVDPVAFASAEQFRQQFVDFEGKPKNVGKLHELMLPYMIRRTREDVYGKLHIERIPFTKELGKEARARYERVLAGIYESLRDNREFNVTSFLAEIMRCKQICSYDNLQATVDLAVDAFEETDKKVIICSQFKDSQYAIKQLLGDSAEVINGDVSDDFRYIKKDEFQDKDSSLKFWITNIPEGLTLTEAHTVIFNDLWWTPKDHQQLEGRAFGRINDPHGGNAYYLQNENTIDEFINQLLLDKMAIVNEMVDGIRVSSESEGDIVKQLIAHLKGF